MIARSLSEVSRVRSRRKCILKILVRNLLCQQAMVVLVTDHTRNLPCTIFVLPQRHKLGIPHTILWTPRVVKAMYPKFHSSKPLQRVHFQRVR
jgi:hypothetical protein